MRNVLNLQLETKTALAVVFIIVAIFIFAVIKSVGNFDKAMKNAEPIRNLYEETEL